LQQRTTQVTLSLLPPPQWDGEKNQKEKGKKLVGWDENSLAECKRRRKEQTIILIKSIYNMQCSHHPMLSLLLSSKKPLLQAAPHLNTEHDITWYRIYHLIGCLGQPSQLLVKTNSIPAEHRTVVTSKFSLS